MTAHPLQEIHFDYWPEGSDGPVDTIVRHMYHVPRIGERVVLSEGSVTINGRISDVVWASELVIMRVKDDE